MLEFPSKVEKVVEHTGDCCINRDIKKASLLLSNGTLFEGFSFGYEESSVAEVVFTTAMVGYPESLSDPSFLGQILVFTYPLIGNYGIPGEDRLDLGMENEEDNILKYFESNKIHLSGVIVSTYSFEHSHWNAKKSLGDWLKEHKIPAIFGVDTRQLTKTLRTYGTLFGKIEIQDHPIDFIVPDSTHATQQISRKNVITYNKGKSPRVVVLDLGVKNSILKMLIQRECEVTVVPYNYDLKAHFGEYDGILVSNGPGDPKNALETIEQLKWVINHETPIPIFGICLGNQLLALAAGAQTSKMRYGNRAANVPCVDLTSSQCYITSQNHGYQVESSTLPPDWQPLFFNANDDSNEGIMHKYKPIFSVQFHPEGNGGPLDTTFLFDRFKSFMVADSITNVPTFLNPRFFRPMNYKKVLILGSGGLSIGQAGEFDYSGSQAIKAMKEEGIEVILMNPNIATVQTSRNLAHRVYFLPVTPHFVTRVIDKEKPDCILVSMGGQTALNVSIHLYKEGILQNKNVRVLGTCLDTVIDTEDRQLFKDRLEQIHERLARSSQATSVEQAIEVAEKIGYPVLIRSAFALGGMGSGFAKNSEELAEIAEKALSTSDQLLIDKDLRGWKEIEYEVVRDAYDNCITVCNMENFDPLGIHTGDSIVVAPCQTLSNSETMLLREKAIKVARHLKIVGECNIQYALNPDSEEYVIIEVNARLSRSSALASKATGYPLAYVAAKLALGCNLIQLTNRVTGTTSACFEPSLDYCVVKIPRWDLKKFQHVSSLLGSCMKSVGEVMSIGRTFEEALQKAVRMVNPLVNGFEIYEELRGYDMDMIHSMLVDADDHRLFIIAYALEKGMSIDTIHDITKIDKWFLQRLYHIHQARQSVKGLSLSNVTKDMMKSLKVLGFGDVQLSKMVDVDISFMTQFADICSRCPRFAKELVVREYRKSLGIVPYVKQVDTLAAEFPSVTNYLYMTYNGSDHDITFEDKGVMVLGCGPYAIGSSVEFDWAAVSCVRALRETQFKSIVVNFNPETVSTDYDESDRLYFEELSLERVLDIYEIEDSQGVIVSVGGQIPNNLAVPLSQNKVKIYGTPANSILTAENRSEFSKMLDSLGIDQPKWVSVTSIDKTKEFVEENGYPILVRPSFVLSGAAMSVCINDEQLERCLSRAANISHEYPVVMSKFIVGAKEIEFDAVANEGEIINYAISEHVENAGVHSGDATLLLPSIKLYTETERRIKQIGKQIAKQLVITGPFNIQLLAINNDVKVIECNLRSSRTFPFISKTFDFNFIDLATRVMVGLHVKRGNISLVDLNYYGCKAPMFSFSRLNGADPTTGVEMASTGEVACYGSSVSEAFLKALLSTNFHFRFYASKESVKEGRNVLLSMPESDFKYFDECIEILCRLNITFYATEGTFKRLLAIPNIDKDRVKRVYKDSERSDTGATLNPSAVRYIRNKGKSNSKEPVIDLAIVIPRGNTERELTDGYHIRRAAVDYNVPLIVNVKCAIEFVRAFEKYTELGEDFLKIVSMEEYYEGNKV